jgi:hypothetical protein
MRMEVCHRYARLDPEIRRGRNPPILKVERDIPTGVETGPDKPGCRGGEEKDEGYKQGADEKGDQSRCIRAHSRQHAVCNHNAGSSSATSASDKSIFDPRDR